MLFFQIKNSWSVDDGELQGGLDTGPRPRPLRPVRSGGPEEHPRAQAVQVDGADHQVPLLLLLRIPEGERDSSKLCTELNFDLSREQAIMRLVIISPLLSSSLIDDMNLV